MSEINHKTERTIRFNDSFIITVDIQSWDEYQKTLIALNTHKYFQYKVREMKGNNRFYIKADLSTATAIYNLIKNVE